jgi:uncharacterized protein (TIGR02284 family)
MKEIVMASTKDYISWLNDLIQTSKDAEQGFRDAAGAIQSPDLRALFNEYASQRTQFASELQTEVSRLGGDPQKSGSVSGSFHRGWMNLKSAITGKDDHAILAEVERGEDAAVKNYQEALAQDLPDDIRSIVEKQYRQILDAHNRVRSLRDSIAIAEDPTRTERTPIGNRTR